MPEKVKATSDPNPHLARPSRYVDVDGETENQPETEIRGETEIQSQPSAELSSQAKRRGRPKSSDAKPWETAGMSRAAWYRQKRSA